MGKAPHRPAEENENPQDSRAEIFRTGGVQYTQPWVHKMFQLATNKTHRDTG